MIKFQVMEDIMQGKARQCKDFHDKLLKSGDKLLVHNMKVTLYRDLVTMALEEMRWGGFS